MDTPWTLRRLIRVVGSPVRRQLGRMRASFTRRFRDSHDPNFIGFDKYARHGAYHWTQLDQNSEYRAKVDALRRILPSAQRCLDLGCGDGAYMYALSQHFEQVVGVDASYSAVKLANREFAKREITTCRCHQFSFGEVTLPKLDVDARFDAVYSMDVIEHLPDPDELLSLATRMVKPDGFIAIGTPLYVSEDLVSPYHVKEFRADEIRELLQKSLVLEDEVILPMTREDHRLHEEGFYIGACRFR
jgi:2-polyprenyl-3-methyl-5-hydroxy-6-metoxy-1,4-benzoquinol methylase